MRVLIIDSVVLYREALAEAMQQGCAIPLHIETAASLSEGLKHNCYDHVLLIGEERMVMAGELTFGQVTTIHDIKDGQGLNRQSPLQDIMGQMGLVMQGSNANQSEILSRLSRRERDIIHWLVRGASNQDIADRLEIKLPTVKLHMRHICQKLQVKNRTQAALVAYAALNGIVFDDGKTALAE